MSIDELRATIAGLSPADLTRFSQWFEEFTAEKWDLEIEQDYSAGRLDAAIEKADDHYDEGRCTPL